MLPENDVRSGDGIIERLVWQGIPESILNTYTYYSALLNLVWVRRREG
jgi:hypothetical protein